MRRVSLFAFATLAFVSASANAQDNKVLMLTKSSGFQHSVVARQGKSGFGLAEKTVLELGKKHGFEVTITKKGTDINTENLKNYKALFFFTQGELTVPGVDKNTPMREQDRPAILEFIRNGGGFVGTHCGGADTFHEWKENGKKPFLEMVGGEFIGHGAQQVSNVEVVDPTFPAVKVWPATFSLNDEWYAYQGFHANMRVLLMLKTENMKGDLYQRPSYPITWCSKYGNGRVFYTGMGHREDVWENPKYQEMVGTAVLWALGKVEGDATPNLKSLFGDEETAVQRINPPKKK